MEEEEEAAVAWEEIGLDDSGVGALLRGVYVQRFDYATQLQRWAIGLMMDGYDVVLHDRPGLGKSTAVTIGALQRLLMLYPESSIGSEERAHDDGVKAVFILPNQGLAEDTHRLIENLTAWTSIRSYLLRGADPLEASVADIQRGGIDVISCTPGRLAHLVNQRILKLDSLRIIVAIELELLVHGFKELLENFFARIPCDQVQTAWTSNMMTPYECEEMMRLNGPRRPVMVCELMRSIPSPPCAHVPTD